MGSVTHNKLYGYRAAMKGCTVQYSTYIMLINMCSMLWGTTNFLCVNEEKFNLQKLKNSLSMINMHFKINKLCKNQSYRNLDTVQCSTVYLQ